MNKHATKLPLIGGGQGRKPVYQLGEPADWKFDALLMVLILMFFALGFLAGHAMN